MKGVGIPDAMVMAEDRMRWKRVVPKHEMPREGMLPERVGNMKHEDHMEIVIINGFVSISNDVTAEEFQCRHHLRTLAMVEIQT